MIQDDFEYDLKHHFCLDEGANAHLKRKPDTWWDSEFQLDYL